jgi:DNA-binding NtrC family response regulator
MDERILVIDDEWLMLDAVKVALDGTGIRVDTATSPEEGIRLFRKRPFGYLSILVDNQYRQEDQSVEALGPMIVEKIRKINQQVQVVMLSGDYSPEALTSWREAGTDKYLWKPFKQEQLLVFIQLARDQAKAAEGITDDSDDIFASSAEKMALRKLGLIGVSKSMGEAAKRALEYAASDLSIMLLGETGTGKELFATGIHENSKRKDKSIISVDCTRYKDKTDLFESEMFGHIKGAFTGADKNRIGFVEAASGGTLFLDEIHHLNHDAQAKLLRVIQNRTIVKVGEHRETKVDFRLVVATKPIIKNMVKNGDFLPDLFYRIFELDINISSLEERKEDIKPLILFFNEKWKQERKITFSKAAYMQLKKYDWPGNVRELEMVIKKSLVNAKTEKVLPRDLPLEVFEKGHLEFSDMQPMYSLEKRQLKERTRLILRALHLSENNKKQASDMLSMKRSTLNDFLRKNKLLNISNQEVKSLLIGN